MARVSYEMSGDRYTDEFKIDAGRQGSERRYSAVEVQKERKLYCLLGALRMNCWSKYWPWGRAEIARQI